MYVGYDTKKVYEGKITIFGDAVVTVNGAPLAPALDVAQYSTSGFSWRYRGSGPTQLAVAIMTDAFGANIARTYAWMLDDLVQSKLHKEKPWVLTEHDLSREFCLVCQTDSTPAKQEAYAALLTFFLSPK